MAHGVLAFVPGITTYQLYYRTATLTRKMPQVVVARCPYCCPIPSIASRKVSALKDKEAQSGEARMIQVLLSGDLLAIY
jgi:hypothetical protein